MDHPAQSVRVRFPGAAVRAIGLILLGALLTAQPSPSRAASSDELAGKSVGDVLDALRSQGLTFIYNTRIVPPRMRIEREPQARTALELASEILAEHGLGLARAAPGVYSVVPQSANVAAPVQVRTPPAAHAGETTLEEVLVYTSRYTLLTDLSASESFLTQEDVNTLPRFGDETLRAVDRLPGIAVNGFSALGEVRGGQPNETAIVLDGLRLYEPFHLKNFLSPVSLLDARWIGSMDVYSGGFPVLYGDRMSGIVNARSIEPAERRYYEAGVSLFHTHALASSRFAGERGRVSAAARRGNIGDLAHLAENGFGEPNYADAFMRLDYRFDDATRGSLDALISRDSIEAIKGAGRERSNARYRNSYVWATLERDWSARFASTAILSYTDVDNVRTVRIADPGRRIARVDDDRTFHIAGLQLQNEFSGELLRHRFGAEVRSFRGEYDYDSDVRFEPGFPFADSPAAHIRRNAQPRPEGFEAAAYWDARAILGERWTLESGLRVDTQTYDHSGDSAQWSPRVNVMYDISADTRVRLSWGRYFQPQDVNELQVEDGVDHFHPAQFADQKILSVDHAFATGLDLRVEAYRKIYHRLYPRFENLFNPMVLAPEAAFDRVMIDASGARAEGVEVLLRMRPHGAWRGWVGYTWSRAYDRVAGSEVRRSWDQEHAVTLGIAWARGPWTATLADSYHTGWPTTQLTIAQDENGVQQVVIGPRNAQRLGAYNSLDVRVTRTFALSRGALDVFLELTNALDRKNSCCIDYTVTRSPDGAPAVDADVETWLPLAPSFGVLWRW